MPAYVVALINVHDPGTYRKYTDRTPSIVKRYGGRFLSRGAAVTALEGVEFDGRMVILEFPDKASAKAWFADADYSQVKAFRHAASTAQLFVLQEGATEPQPSELKA